VKLRMRLSGYNNTPISKQELPSFFVISKLRFNSRMASRNTCNITTLHSTGEEQSAGYLITNH
jgi:hypothetical protein